MPAAGHEVRAPPRTSATSSPAGSFTAPASPGDPGFSSNRLLGDYQFLMAKDGTFYGTFAGRGDVNARSIDTTGMIVPFCFSVSAVPEPGSFVLLQIGAAAVGAIRRLRAARA